jgi:hypothetical protein
VLPYQLNDGSRNLPIEQEDNNYRVFPKTPQSASTPSEYNPFSFLSAVGKIAEAAVLRSLEAFIDANHALPGY